MAKNKRDYLKIGCVWQTEHGLSIKLGDPDAKNEKYRVEVDVRVTDGEGNKFVVKNGWLSLKKPFTTNKDGSQRSVPENLVYEVKIAKPEND